MSRRPLILLIAMAAAALSAGCGGARRGVAATPSSATPTTYPGSTATVTFAPPTDPAPTYPPGMGFPAGGLPPGFPTSVLLPPRGVFTVTPKVATIDGRFSARGTGCTAAIGQSVGVYNGFGGRLMGAATPDSHGDWRLTAPVAGNDPVGDVQLYAQCGPPNGPLYPPVTVRITTYRRVQVVPTTTRPGGTLSLRSLTPCPATPMAYVDVRLQLPEDQAPSGWEKENAATFQQGARGDWSGTLHVPEDTPAGADLVLDVSCDDGRSYQFFYMPVSLTIMRD